MPAVVPSISGSSTARGPMFRSACSDLYCSDAGSWKARTLESSRAIVFAELYALPHGTTASDERGGLRAAASFERLFRDLRGFVRFAEAIEPLCCAPPPVGDAPQRAAEIAAALESETELQPET